MEPVFRFPAHVFSARCDRTLSTIRSSFRAKILKKKKDSVFYIDREMVTLLSLILRMQRNLIGES